MCCPSLSTSLDLIFRTGRLRRSVNFGFMRVNEDFMFGENVPLGNPDVVEPSEATIDPHVHMDWSHDRADWHGVPLEDLAQALHERANSRSSRLNLAVVANHNHVDRSRFFGLKQILDDLAGESRRRVQLLFGVASNVRFLSKKVYGRAKTLFLRRRWFR